MAAEAAEAALRAQEQAEAGILEARRRAEAEIEALRAEYPTRLAFEYRLDRAATRRPFLIEAMWHDGEFTYHPFARARSGPGSTNSATASRQLVPRSRLPVRTASLRRPPRAGRRLAPDRRPAGAAGGSSRRTALRVSRWKQWVKEPKGALPGGIVTKGGRHPDRRARGRNAVLVVAHGSRSRRGGRGFRAARSRGRWTNVTGRSFAEAHPPGDRSARPSARRRRDGDESGRSGGGRRLLRRGIDRFGIRRAGRHRRRRGPPASARAEFELAGGAPAGGESNAGPARCARCRWHRPTGALTVAGTRARGLPAAAAPFRRPRVPRMPRWNRRPRVVRGQSIAALEAETRIRPGRRTDYAPGSGGASGARTGLPASRTSGTRP